MNRTEIGEPMSGVMGNQDPSLLCDAVEALRVFTSPECTWADHASAVSSARDILARYDALSAPKGDSQ